MPDAPKMTPEQRAEKREAAVQGLVDKGYTRERAEELIGLIAGALFAPGKPFGRPIPPENDAHEPFDLARELEALCPSSLAAHLDPSRPYDGQPHTVHGERGRTEVRGITFRDLTDAFVRACYESSGLPIKEWPGSVHDLPWDQMDIMAVSQNLGCNIEKAMGIYPNVPRPYPVDPTEPHWCGHPLDVAVYQAHQGHCDDPEKRVIPPGKGEAL